MKTKDRLLIMACGGTKNDVGDREVKAIDLYAGRQFDLARKLVDKGWNVLILSAEHGLIPSYTKIKTYDRLMDRARATELANCDFTWHILKCWGQDADEIVFYGGENYHDVWDAAIDANDFAMIDEDGGKDIVRIVGRGCGDHFSVLKEIVNE